MAELLWLRASHVVAGKLVPRWPGQARGSTSNMCDSHGCRLEASVAGHMDSPPDCLGVLTVWRLVPQSTASQQGGSRSVLTARTRSPVWSSLSHCQSPASWGGRSTRTGHRLWPGCPSGTGRGLLMAGLPRQSRGLARWEILLCSHTSSGGPVPAARPPTPAPLPRSQFRDTFSGFIPTVVTLTLCNMMPVKGLRHRSYDPGEGPGWGSYGVCKGCCPGERAGSAARYIPCPEPEDLLTQTRLHLRVPSIAITRTQPWLQSDSPGRKPRWKGLLRPTCAETHETRHVDFSSKEFIFSEKF